MPRKASRNREKPQAGDRYLIDSEWYQDEWRDFGVAVNSRRCLTCQRDVETGEDARDPIVGIVECCSQKAHFLHPEMPILEGVFRVLLAAGNEARSAEEIRKALVEWGFDPVARDLSKETLERMIQRDDYYGLKKSGASSGVPKAA